MACRSDVFLFKTKGLEELRLVKVQESVGSWPSFNPIG
jgi:hypothetical protein